MKPDFYRIFLISTFILHIANIVFAIYLASKSKTKKGFALIALGVAIIFIFQLYQFLHIDFDILFESIFPEPFEIISFISSLVLFILIISLIFLPQLPSLPEETKYIPFTKGIKEFTSPLNASFFKYSPPEQEKLIEVKEQTPPKEEHIETTYKEEKLEDKIISKPPVVKLTKREQPHTEIDKCKTELEKIKFQRDKLVSIISHDLRTPLNSVFGYVQLLQEGQYKNKREVKKFSENIFELSKQQLNALNKIIEWTKYESSDLSLNPAEFDVTSTINFVVKTMMKAAAQKNIKIVVSSKPDLFVYADEFMIIDVLKNLIENAIKFSHPGGTIEIITHFHEKINKLIVLVVDMGVGIDRDILVNLLDGIKKYTTRGTKGEKGLGLGLLICKAILDKHGEYLWIASEKGKWTRVYFTLTPSKDRH